VGGRGAGPRRADLAAIGWLCLGVLVFSLQDVIIKALSGAYPVHQIVVVRCLVAMPILLSMVHRGSGGVRAVASPRAGWLALRGLALAVAVTAYYLAFPVMRLADVLALYATVPLFVTGLAGPVLGERVGARRWAAVCAGFVGALVMLRPGAGVFEPASLLPVLAAATYAAAQLMARRLGAAEPAAAMAFHQNLVFLAVAAGLALAVAVSGGARPGHPSLEFLLRPWVAPGWRDLLLLAACGPIAALGTVLLAQAYRGAEANLVAPFEYTGLVWGTVWGYALWGEVPGSASLAGGALIVAAGLYLVSTGPRAPPAAQGTDALADRGRAFRARL
jgi:drug/metabolite transporter (DMT)-like permease